MESVQMDRGFIHQVMDSKLYRKYKSIMESGYIEHSQIKSLKQILNGKHTSMTDAELEYLRALYLYQLNGHVLRLSKEQQDKGYYWLWNGTYTKTGRLRSNPMLDNELADMIQPENFNGFWFVGFDMEKSRITYRVEAREVYQVNTRDGRYFAYTPLPWQQGYNGNGIYIHHKNLKPIEI
jgi:hypothetical protein